MAVCREVRKVGLATLVDGQLLVVRKRGGQTFILPGGKPEGEEQDIETLQRELAEELGCSVIHARYEGDFTDRAADLLNTVVIVRLYTGRLRGVPEPHSEIEELAWINPARPHSIPLAPSLTNHILPHVLQMSSLKVKQGSQGAVTNSETDRRGAA